MYLILHSKHIDTQFQTEYHHLSEKFYWLDPMEIAMQLVRPRIKSFSQSPQSPHGAYAQISILGLLPPSILSNAL
jgi:hypothetical protein